MGFFNVKNLKLIFTTTSLLIVKKMNSIYKQWTEGLDNNIIDIINGYLFKEQRKLKEDIDKTFHRIHSDRLSRNKSFLCFYDHQTFNTRDIPFLDCIDIWSISPELIDDVKVYISVKFAIKIFERYKRL